LDSLDRTSVVQQAVCKIMVHKQLDSLNILEKSENSEENQYIFYGLYSFQKTFNTMWGKICDSISFQYAGTDALKVIHLFYFNFYFFLNFYFILIFIIF
jgi:hypothetical protein